MKAENTIGNYFNFIIIPRVEDSLNSKVFTKTLQRLHDKIGFSCIKSEIKDERFLIVKTCFNLQDMLKNLAGEICSIQLIGNTTKLPLALPHQN